MTQPDFTKCATSKTTKCAIPYSVHVETSANESVHCCAVALVAQPDFTKSLPKAARRSSGALRSLAQQLRRAVAGGN